MKTLFQIIEISLAVIIPMCLIALVWEMIPATVKKGWRYYWTEMRGQK